MAVSWCAKKQGGVSLSTTEAEFVAASEVARELLGIHKMLCETGAVPKLPMLMHVDNQASIRQIEGVASSLKANILTFELSLCAIFARRRVVLAQYVRSEQLLTGLLTKALDATKLAKLRALMRVG